MNEFMENLDKTREFHDLRSVDERANDEGRIESVLEMLYTPEAPRS